MNMEETPSARDGCWARFQKSLSVERLRVLVCLDSRLDFLFSIVDFRRNSVFLEWLLYFNFSNTYLLGNMVHDPDVKMIQTWMFHKKTNIYQFTAIDNTFDKQTKMQFHCMVWLPAISVSERSHTSLRKHAKTFSFFMNLHGIEQLEANTSKRSSHKLCLPYGGML